MSLDEDVSNLIKRIYCAGSDPAQWESVGREITERFRASVGMTTLVDLGDREFKSMRFYGLEDTKFATGIEEYSHFYNIDPSLSWAQRNPRARYCDSRSTLAPDKYDDDEYVRWNHARFGARHWYVGFTPFDDRLSYSFSLHFPAVSGPPSEKDLRLFRMLFDHMECSIRLSLRPFNPESNRVLLLLDDMCRVRELSTAAETFLHGDGLAIQGMRLRADHPEDQEKLDRALAESSAAPRTGASKTAVQIRRRSGARPYILTIRPLIGRIGPFERGRCELLVQVHSEQSELGTPDWLQSLFGLTGREVELLTLLAGGHSVESSACRMFISPNTGRAHLRAIFAKTGTTRQSELIQLVTQLSSS